ncbi:sodium/glutamate symporter [uncultured Megasphaera sp.]|uniref:sodium/glutamate symporter n=1 Tax=uncultured Megasphaera sp. TaxID=165188 RepID=UPI0025E07379|nr:sodium/glutamate symporter [uncultured Megasphaera sp.]
MSLNLNIYQTLAAAIVVYYIGVFLRVKISVLRKYCIPAPVVGGILFAIINCILYTQGIWKYEQDTIMQNICMMLFFTSVGYTASISLIKRGGVMVLKMAIVTTVLIICQNIIGSGLAMAFNLSPLLGLATGSIPMVGGHGTAAAFGPLLESIGLDGGVTIAVAAATFGLVAGGVIGGPIGEELVHKFHLVSSAESERFDPSFNASTVSTLKAVAGNKERAENAIKIENKIGQTIDNYRFMNAMAHLFLAMGLGTLVSGFFSSIGLVFPGYIGSMIVAAIIRNIADFTHAYKIYQRESEVLGNLSLTVFLTCVLMSLKLWQLADLAIPLVVMLLSQALFMAIFAYFIVFRAMGKDYEAAVMTSGVCGFGLGATPNAIANMTAMTELFGPAPTAFFVIPLIGSLIIDPVNASIITVFINIFH